METLVKAASVLNISEREWYAYGAASLLIACKCHELDDNLPSLEEIIVVMETSPLLEDIKYELSLAYVMKLEQDIVNALVWDVAPVIVFDSIETLMSVGILFEGDKFEKHLSSSKTSKNGIDEEPEKRLEKSTKNMNKIVRVLCRVSMFIKPMKQFKPTLVGAATLYLARQLVRVTPFWSPALEDLTGYA